MLGTRLALPGALVLCAISACGGSAFTSDSDATGGTPGGTSAGGSDSGGTLATGGKNASGGAKASGGASATGGTSSTGGTNAAGRVSATGGTIATGGASARGGTSGSGGSGGLKNTGGSGGQANFDACTASSQCTLVNAGGCCAACEPTQLSDFIAVNSARANDYQATRNCTNALCAPCLEPTPQATQSGNYGARCVSGHCQAFDVRATELSACESNADCRLRVGVRCCEGCSGGLAAVSKDADLQQALCGDPSGPGGAVACPACAPLLPSTASPSCSANGHCAVTWSGIGTD